MFFFFSRPAHSTLERCSWSLTFYLLEHYQASLGDSKDDLLSFVLTTLKSKTCPDFTVSLITEVSNSLPESVTNVFNPNTKFYSQGTERLLLVGVADDRFIDQVSKVSLDLISHNSTSLSRNGLQLLMVLSFLGESALLLLPVIFLDNCCYRF